MTAVTADTFAVNASATSCLPIMSVTPAAVVYARVGALGSIEFVMPYAHMFSVGSSVEIIGYTSNDIKINAQVASSRAVSAVTSPTTFELSVDVSSFGPPGTIIDSLVQSYTPIISATVIPSDSIAPIYSSTRVLIRIAKNRVRMPLRLRRKHRASTGSSYIEPL